MKKGWNVMAGKLEGNGLFESSRMMLPEHKEAFIRYIERQSFRERVLLDEQEIDRFNQHLYASKTYKHPIEIKMYDPYEELYIVGVIERVDQQLKRFKVDGEWFYLRDIENIMLSGELEI